MPELGYLGILLVPHGVDYLFTKGYASFAQFSDLLRSIVRTRGQAFGAPHVHKEFRTLPHRWGCNWITISSMFHKGRDELDETLELGIIPVKLDTG